MNSRASLALWVGEHHGVRMLHLERHDLGGDHAVVDGAVAAVEDEVLLGHLQAYVVAEVHVRDEEDVLLRKRADHLDGVGGGDAHV